MKTTIAFDDNGGALDFLASHGIADWSLQSYGNYVRQYQYGNFSITLIGDFGAQSNTLSGDTRIFGYEYHDLTTNTGGKVFGINTIAEYMMDSVYLWDDIDEWADVTGSHVAEVIETLDGDDIVDARGGDDLIITGWGEDVVDAGAGDDTIYGGPDWDTLTGGVGLDQFVYRTDEDSSTGYTYADIITDFVVGEDVIDLHDFEVTRFTKRGFGYEIEWDFDWRGTRALRPGKEDLHYRRTLDEDNNPITLIEGNTNRDRKPEFTVQLEGHHKLTADDFFL